MFACERVTVQEREIEREGERRKIRTSGFSISSFQFFSLSEIYMIKSCQVVDQTQLITLKKDD